MKKKNKILNLIPRISVISNFSMGQHKYMVQLVKKHCKLNYKTKGMLTQASKLINIF